MLKTISGFVIGAIVAAAMGTAFAIIGQPPVQGYSTPDGSWLLGITYGHNRAFQNAFTAAGTTQATALQLPARTQLLEIDTVAASTGVALAPALQGVVTAVYNNGANTLTVYPAILNNPVTAAQDTINNTTSFSLASHVSMLCFSAKNGVWACQ